MQCKDTKKIRIMQIVLLSLENLHWAERFKLLAGLSETRYCEMNLSGMYGWGKIAKFFRCFFLRIEGKNSHFYACNMHIIRVLYLKVCTMSARCPHDRCSEGALFSKKQELVPSGKIAKFFTL